MHFQLIAFDADDTLWHEMRKYESTEELFVDLLSNYCDPKTVLERLRSADVENLRYYGFGVKGFILSMIDAAVTLTEGQVTGAEIGRIIQWGKNMLDHPIECFPHVETTLANLARTYTLVLITKGDLLDQETKVARSGLAQYFDYVEIVSSKDPATYAGLLEKYGVSAENFLMIGNALRSDILPVVSIGGSAVHIPSAHDWDFENDKSADTSQFDTLQHIGQIPAYVANLENTL
ncbi:MAG: HAD family hydrolase [Candidatus Promineifilaceae bacterium]